MIETPYKCRFPTEIGIKETEEILQERWPGLRLAPGHKDIGITNEWLYTIWFEQEQDYTWFTLTFK
jgi:hypothetical protein